MTLLHTSSVGPDRSHAGRPVLVALLLASASGTACDSGSGPEVLRPAALAVVSGQGQSAEVGAGLAEPLVVRVTDARGRPVPGAPLTWTVLAGGGALAPAAATGTDGTAKAYLTVGVKAGANTVVAGAAGLPSVTFSATGKAGAPTTLRKVSGDAQTGAVGAALPASLVVGVADKYDNPVSGTVVEWIAASGHGSANPATSLSDAEGQARTQWTIAGTVGAKTMTARTSGGVSASFTAEARAGAASRLVKASGDGQSGVVAAALAQPLVARVTDASGNPVEGVSVTWSVATGGGSVTPAISTSDRAGEVRSSWTLGTVSGSQSASASAPGIAAVPFSATALPGAVATVAVTPADSSIAPGKTVQLTAAPKDAYGNAVPGRTIAWASGKPDVATVDGKGLVTGVALGTTSVTADTEGKAGRATVRVEAKQPEAYTRKSDMVTSSVLRLPGVVVPNGAPSRVWFRYGLDPQLVTFTETQPFGPFAQNVGVGQVVSGLSASTTYYYRLLAENSVGRALGSIVSVTTSPASGGTRLLTTAGLSGAAGSSQTAQFDVPSGTSRIEVVASGGSGDVDLFLRYGGPASGDDADCDSAFHPSVIEICTLDNPTSGTWHILLWGNSAFSGITLTATSYGGASGVSVSVSPTSATLSVGGTRQFTATVSGSTNTAVTWSSSNTSVATVTSSGLVTAVTAGEARIRATSQADPTKSAEAVVTVTSSTGVAAFDGTYVGRYTGKFSGEDVTDVVIFRVSDGVITVILPGAGAGRVDATGAATFTGGLGVAGVQCNYLGRFELTTGGGAAANGTWTCQGGGETGSGTWSTVRQSLTSNYIPGGVWINASWSWARTTTPDTRKAVTDPALTLGSHCPQNDITLDKVFDTPAQQVARIRAIVTCDSPPPIFSCVAKGSEAQPVQGALGGAPLQQCATDPLETTLTYLRRDALVFTGAGVVMNLYLTHPILNLNVFYCRPRTTLVGPPHALRLQCV